MHSGKLVFSQVMDFLPLHTFRRCVSRYRGNHKVKRFSCFDQYLCMAFAQLAHRESVRDVETCLRAQHSKLHHMGLRSQVSRNTLANANSRRDWRIYADFAQALIRIARPLYVDDDFGLELKHTVYALDSSTIDLCLSVFPWARFKQGKAAVKLHTLLDLRGPIPSFIHVSDGKLHDVNLLDMFIPEPGAFYLFDRAYLDFQRLFHLHQLGAFFVTRYRKRLMSKRRYSNPVDKSTGLRYDQTIFLTGENTRKFYPMPLRRVKFYDAQNNQNSRLPHQQLRPARFHHHRALSLSIAHRSVLQVGQTTPSYQGFLRSFTKCSTHTNLDRNIYLRACGHRQETTPYPSVALHNSPDSASLSLKNTAI